MLDNFLYCVMPPLLIDEALYLYTHLVLPVRLYNLSVCEIRMSLFQVVLGVRIHFIPLFVESGWKGKQSRGKEYSRR